MKKQLRYFLKSLVEFTTNNTIPDINSGLRIFSQKESQKILYQLSNAFSFTTSITLVYMLNHKFVTYIPIPYEKRVGNSKVRIVRDIFRTLQYIFEIILYYNPVKIYILLLLPVSILGLLSGLVYGIWGFKIAELILFSNLLAVPMIVVGSMLAMQFKQYKIKE